MTIKQYLTFATMLASLTVAQAATHTFEANFDGLQEVPPNASPAFGFGEFTLNDSTGAFTVSSGSYQDLLGGATAVTLNNGVLGANGSVIFSLTLDTPGAGTGTFSGSGTLTGPQIIAVEAGNFYANIRSTVFPSGEIRGQLTETPEPATLALAGLGALALFAARRSKAA